MTRPINKLVENALNGEIKNEVGSKADVLGVLASLSKKAATQVEELEIA